MNLFSRLMHFVTVKEGGSIEVCPENQNTAAANYTEENYKTIGEGALQTAAQCIEAGSNKCASATPVNSDDGSSNNMVQDGNNINDGADEQMLGAEDNDKLSGRRDEVKFIKGDHQNGDAKIDIGPVNEKAFTGMSKEELMKYANDPFWVRLRWIFFIAFWGIWVGMLVGAILIIVGAPKCAAPEPLTWYKRGLLAKFGSVDDVTPNDVAATKKLLASGAIYELPAALTYDVATPEIEAKVKHLIEQYKDADVEVILDLTPNIVGRNSELFKDALADKSKRSAFVWHEDTKEPTNWLKVGGTRTAWNKIDDRSYVLSQFEDDTFDLRMNDTIVFQKFTTVLKHLVGLGVRGFRLKNTKFFLLKADLNDEDINIHAKNKGDDLQDYGFYTHYRTTFQEGLGDLLYEYLTVVKNTSSDAFLSVAEDMINPESYQTKNDGPLGIDLPMYGQFLKNVSSRVDLRLKNELEDSVNKCGNHSWVQWNFADVYHDTPVNPSAIALFMALLPGVPVVPVDSTMYVNNTDKTYAHIEELRESQSYMHGNLDVYEAQALVAYSRIKSGNPGYFVIFNPTAQAQAGNFTSLLGLPKKMTVMHLSDNFDSASDIKPKAKVDIPTLELQPYSTVVLTYVPDKTD